MAIGIGIGLNRSGAGRAEARLIKYQLIDGAFFEGLVREYGRILRADLWSDFRWDIFQSGCHRTIYYDALPVKKDGQSQTQFEQIEAEKEAAFDRLRSLPNMHVRDGLTRLKTKNRGSHMSQVFEQKGVDTWIAVDAMQFALTGLADEIHIFTSDSDLYPVFEALQQTRCKGILNYHEGKTVSQLIYSADVALPITISKVIHWSGQSNIYQVSPAKDRANLEEIGQISSKTRSVKIYRKLDGYHFDFFEGERFRESFTTSSLLQIVDWANGHGMQLTYSDLAKIDRG